jgi:hypothetical protein
MIESSTPVNSSGASGATCSASGPYYCTSHPDTMLFVRKTQTFPNCPISRNRKGHSTTWSAETDAQAMPISTVDNLDSTAL